MEKIHCFSFWHTYSICNSRFSPRDYIHVVGWLLIVFPEAFSSRSPHTNLCYYKETRPSAGINSAEWVIARVLTVRKTLSRNITRLSRKLRNIIREAGNTSRARLWDFSAVAFPADEPFGPQSARFFWCLFSPNSCLFHEDGGIFPLHKKRSIFHFRKYTYKILNFVINFRNMYLYIRYFTWPSNSSKIYNFLTRHIFVKKVPWFCQLGYTGYFIDPI